MRALPLVLLALLASGAVATPPGWDQLQGGPERAGVVDLQDAPLDVLGWYSVVGPGERLNGGPRIVQTPGGFVGFASGDDGCSLVTIPDPVANASTRRDVGECAGGVLAYDPARALLFACGRAVAAGTVLEAWDPDEGALRWALRAEALAATVPDAPDLIWQCGAGALDVGEGALYMPFSGARNVGPDEDFAAQQAHRIVKLHAATGQVLWRTEVPEWVFRGGATGPDLPDAIPDPFAASGRAGFAVFGLTLTQTGLVVTGFRSCACVAGVDDAGVQQEGGAAWLTREGDVRGGTLARGDYLSGAEAVGTTRYVSNWATAQGAVAALGLGGNLVLVNPVEGEPIARIPIRAVESSRDYYGITGPAWHEGTLVVPLSHSVSAFDVDSQAPLWSWTNGPEWDAARVVIARPADVYVLNAQISDLEAQDDVGAAELVRLSLDGGDVLQRIPLPFLATRGDGRWGADILPLDDGTALVVSGEGNVAVLGTADEGILPHVEVASTYPSLGSTVTVRVSAPVDGARFIVSWAEGAPANATQGETLEHRYVTAGARVLRVTSVYPDGRTATREVPLFVGAPEPPSNFVAKAFAPESQNVTFGVLGLAATAVGAVVALVIRRRRRSVLDAELRRLEEIREKAAHDPAAGSRALCVLRRRLRADLASGRLDDAQFSLLENRLSGLLRGARRRLLVPFVPHMSRAYRMLVESALEDGHVTPAEARHLVLALDVETGMGQEVKDGLRALFEGWNAEEEAAIAAAG